MIAPPTGCPSSTVRSTRFPVTSISCRVPLELATTHTLFAAATTSEASDSTEIAAVTALEAGSIRHSVGEEALSAQIELAPVARLTQGVPSGMWPWGLPER